MIKLSLGCVMWVGNFRHNWLYKTSPIEAILGHLLMNSFGLISHKDKNYIYSKQYACGRQDISTDNALLAFCIIESLERNTKYEWKMRVRPKRLSAGGLWQMSFCWTINDKNNLIEIIWRVPKYWIKLCTISTFFSALALILLYASFVFFSVKSLQSVMRKCEWTVIFKDFSKPAAYVV